MSLRLVPPSTQPTTTASTTSSSSTTHPGLPDPLRRPQTSTTSTHPLEQRLKTWNATQESLKMESLRRTFGIAEPIRRGMEMKIVTQGSWRPACLGGGGDDTGMDVLKGVGVADGAVIGWEDVFRGDELLKEPVGFHDELERRLRMDW